jgi:hypothetical protein
MEIGEDENNEDENERIGLVFKNTFGDVMVMMMMQMIMTVVGGTGQCAEFFYNLTHDFFVLLKYSFLCVCTSRKKTRH